MTWEEMEKTDMTCRLKYVGLVHWDKQTLG